MNNPGTQDTVIGTSHPHSLVFRTRAVLTVALLAASVVACAPVDQGIERDVGNMAYPAPLPQGNLDTVAVSGRRPLDTGNMAFPEPLAQGNVGTTAVSGRQPRDTGNMAYPAPSPVGNVATTTVR